MKRASKLTPDGLALALDLLRLAKFFGLKSPSLEALRASVKEAK